MAKNKPVYIISDSPEKDSSLFGFDAYANTLAELIVNKDNRTPLVIGIYGPWGSGKTSLMETIRTYLGDPKKYKDRKLFRKAKTVWFQAWKYNEDDEILAALIEEIFKTMQADGFFESFKVHMEKLIKGFDKSKAVGKITDILTGTDISEFFSELDYKEKLGFYDTFQDFFDRLLWNYLNWRPKTKMSEKPDDTKGALVVFIDDLDRCPEDRILKVLETIKLFMDKEGCVFIIGAANEIIEKALRGRYDGDEASQFMDKIVQVTFNLPLASEADCKCYVEKICPNNRKVILPHLPLIVSAVKNNPRRLKRFLNNLSLQEGLFKNKGIEVTFANLLHWNIIDYVYPLLREEVKENPAILIELKQYISEIDETITDMERWDIPKEQLDKIPQSLQQYVQEKGLADIVRNIEVNRNQLDELITFCKIVESTEESKEKPEAEKRIALDNMAEVPAGIFPYGNDKHEENIEEAFLIDIYPVTNSQFLKFIEADGYSSNEMLTSCWSDNGQNWRAKNKVLQPRQWTRNNDWQPDHPVTGVTYYEAEAYAKWADKRLPTEIEWEKAARGTAGWIYPWGEEFDEERCNTRESGLNKTTRVARYPNGVSPYGCYDMAGNVWEWTYSIDEKGNALKVIRGGSWLSNQAYARCANRSRINPGYRFNDVGFRCVRTLKK